MPPGQPSRRSLLSSLAAAFAWLAGANAVKADAPAAQTPPPAPPREPDVIRVAETAPAPRDPLSGTTTYHYSAGGDLVYSTNVGGGATTYVYDALPRPVSYGYNGVVYASEPAPLPAPGPPRKAHASCRLETPGGEALGREEYEVVIEGGRRLVRVTTLGPDGKVVRAEDVPF